MANFFLFLVLLLDAVQHELLRDLVQDQDSQEGGVEVLCGV